MTRDINVTTADRQFVTFMSLSVPDSHFDRVTTTAADVNMSCESNSLSLNKTRHAAAATAISICTVVKVVVIA